MSKKDKLKITSFYIPEKHKNAIERAINKGKYESKAHFFRKAIKELLLNEKLIRKEKQIEDD